MRVLGGKLYVSDTSNNRVLVWNSVPTANTPADFALGQATFSAHASGTDLAAMSAPSGLVLFHGKLIVADTGNGRLLLWDHPPTASGTRRTTNSS